MKILYVGSLIYYFIHILSISVLFLTIFQYSIYSLVSVPNVHVLNLLAD
jgi:hypothetical protein